MGATITQLGALAGLLAGLYLLLGPAWALTIGSGVALIVSVSVEYLSARAAARARAQTSGRAPARARGVE